MEWGAFVEFIHRVVMAVTVAAVVTLVSTLALLKHLKYVKRMQMRVVKTFILDESGGLREVSPDSIPEDLKKTAEALEEKLREAVERVQNESAKQMKPYSRKAIIIQAIVTFTALSIILFYLYSYLYK